MTLPSERFSQLRWLQNLVCIVALVGSGALVLAGLLGYGDSPKFWLVVAGGFGLFITLMMMILTPLLLKIESTMARQLSELRDLQDNMKSQANLLAGVEENTRISDAAKSLAHRDMELQALRTAIRESIHMQKWETTSHFIDEMERRFGFKDEADLLRGELDDERNSTIQAKLNEALGIIEKYFAGHHWEQAAHEIDRLSQVMPNDVRVQSLQDRMATLKEQYKKELRLQWDDAVRRSDTDLAIDLLRALDGYLSPAEAQAMQEQARTVFKDKLLQLGIQFRFAVTEKRWQDALTTGLEIVRDFPNVRMANEVREALDTLRDKARIEAQDAHAEHAS